MTYPTRDKAAEAWQQLAEGIAADVGKLTDTAAREPINECGELTIIGSGIGVMGFSRNAEQYIDDADHVFFCVADPATQVWLRNKRPDALDLYVLYDDRKPRSATYTQMTEAMLYHVRRGKRVVAIYYGHPGIFVLSTHRAIAIARREGHAAKMLPGVSALDCLCADLGVDPAYPGMQTFEATDMLLRRRAIDVHSHLVLWQVGLIAEMGFRRRGFHNSRFDYLVDYLEGYYSQDHNVTHYIAAKYPTLDPVIDVIPIRELRDLRVQRRISGISTFYIPPGQARAIDIDFAREVGLIRPGQSVGKPRALRDVDRYGPMQLSAVKQLEDFQIPTDYHFQENTGAANFVLALSESPELRRRYKEDPAATVDCYAGLTPSERQRLSGRTRGGIQLATQGSLISNTPAEQCIIDLQTKPALRREWQTVLNKAVKAQPKDWNSVNAWLNAHYAGLKLSDLPPAIDSVRSFLMMMWNGAYAGTGSTPDVLFVSANSSNNPNGSAFFNASALYNVAFSNSTLTFDVKDGNPCNGRFVFTTGSPATVEGYTWPKGGVQPSAPNFSGTMQGIPTNPLSVWCGEYTTVHGNVAGPNVGVFLADATNAQPYVVVGTTTVTDGTFSGTTFTWDSGGSNITFAVNDSGVLSFTGTISGTGAVTGSAVATASTGFDGQYVTQALQTTHSGSQVWQPFYQTAFAQSSGQGTLTIGANSVTGTYTNRKFTWSGGPKGLQNGEIYFAVNGFTEVAIFSGVKWDGDPNQRPNTTNFQGVFSPNALLNFKGSYQSTLDGAAAEVLTINGNSAADTTVTYGSTTVAATFNAGTMKGLAGSQSLSATFGYDASTGAVVTEFTGTISQSGSDKAWVSSSLSNDMVQWGGAFDTQHRETTNNTFVPDEAELVIVATSASSFSVSLLLNGNAIPLNSAKYTQKGNVLTWHDETAAGDYANGAVSFYIDTRTQHKMFQGVKYKVGETAPVEINWKGIPHQSHPDKPTKTPDYVWWLVGIAGVGLLGIGGYFLRARIMSWFQSSANNDATELAQLLEKKNC